MRASRPTLMPCGGRALWANTGQPANFSRVTTRGVLGFGEAGRQTGNG